MNFLYRLLDIPFVYKLSQSLLAPGAHKFITSRINHLFDTLPAAKKLLDIGCGPASLLWQYGHFPVGLDLSHKYAVAYNKNGMSVVGSSDQLPFADNSFQGIFSIGLLHHLPDSVAESTISEMCRISSGYVAILDAVFPKHPLLRPIAYIMRRMDRGEFVRRQDHMISLLPAKRKWVIDRFTYSYFGYELIQCVSLPFTSTEALSRHALPDRPQTPMAKKAEGFGMSRRKLDDSQCLVRRRART